MSGGGTEFSIEAFLAELEAIPWFGRIGEPSAADTGVVRLGAWDEWPGPHDPGVDELFQRQQGLYDALLADAGEERPRLLALWERVRETVLRAAASRVPYDPEQDCYHAPTTAVWAAIWAAGLICWCRYTRRPVPEDLAEQWRWFRGGFWPAGYARAEESGRIGPLLVL